MEPATRSPFHRRAVCFLSAAILASFLTPAAGQTAANDPIALQREYVRALLQSPDAKNQAWGAWIAGRDMMREMIPAVQTVVVSRMPGGGMPENAALDAGLDALIQLGARVDPMALLALYDRRPAQALVLLAHADDQGTNEVLLGLVGREKGLPWFASANLASARRIPGFAAMLLRDLEITISVTVSDEGDSGVGGGGGRGAGVGCGAVGLAPGLPPWATYSLTGYPQTGDTVLALGPQPVYYRRRVSTAGFTPSGSSQEITGPDHADRMMYLARLAGLETASMPVRAIESYSLAWRGQTALTDAVARIQNDVWRRVETLMQILIGAGALTNEEAPAVRPRVTFTVNDVRTARGK